MTERQRYEIAFNARTTLYEIHRAGCTHLISKHLEVTGSIEATSGEDAARTFEAQNDGCLAKLGPCAKARREERR